MGVGAVAAAPGAENGGCPKTRQECAAKIAAAGPSPFVEAPNAAAAPLPANSSAFFNTGASSGAGDPSVVVDAGESCPKMTREVLLASIKQGAEDTVGPNGGFVRKLSDGTNSMVMCKGSSFPKTEKNDRNIEVLAAWRSIIQNPQFKVSTADRFFLTIHRKRKKKTGADLFVLLLERRHQRSLFRVHEEGEVRRDQGRARA